MLSSDDTSAESSGSRLVAAPADVGGDPARDEARPAGPYRNEERLTAIDRVGLGSAFLLLVAFFPPLMFDGWTVRMALLLMVAPLGLVLLVEAALRRELSAMLLMAAVIWSGVAALASGVPRSTLIGVVGRDLSLLTVVAVAGCWAIGRSMTITGRERLPLVVMWAATLGVAVGVVQLVADVRSGPLALFGSRPTGFYSNPVFYGAIAASITMLAVAAWTSSRWVATVLPTVVGGIGVTASGSRVALIAAVVGLVVFVAVRRTTNVVVPVVVAVGSLAAGMFIDRSAGSGRNAADRLGESTGGGRLEAWKYGLEAFLDRPFLGYGFGRFRPAVQGRFSTEFVRDHAPDDLTQAWFDAHNIAVTLPVAVGIVGTCLFAAWVIVARPRTGGPLVWGLLPIAVHWMLQPMSLLTLPLAMMLFGAAAGATPVTRLSRGHLAALLVGLVAAGGLLLGDIWLKVAADAGDGSSASSAATLFLGDPVVNDVVAQVWAFDTSLDREAEALRWHRRAAAAEPDRPFWWTQLARAELAVGNLDEADDAVRRALDLQPTNARALRTVAMLAIERGDRSDLERALDELCPVSPNDCTLGPDELLNAGDAGPD